MLLCGLLSQQRLNVDAIGVLLDFQIEHLVAVVDVLEREGILQHPSSGELDEEVPSHVVGEIRHHDCPLPCLLNTIATHLHKVQVPVNIHGTPLVLYHMGGREDFTVTLVEVKECHQVVAVGGGEHVRRPQAHFEPGGHRVHFKSAHFSKVNVFFDLHVDAESGGVEVKHDGLLFESEAVGSGTHYLLEVLVNGLFNEDVG